ncbi:MULTISPECIES: hypothetical protein [Brevibacterium]|uniref:Uncharacterized protein n=2 Tax=Brevibacterium TaxID=1696 RepID=A0ABP9U6L6_9MICO
MDIGEVLSAGGELLGWWFETFKSSEETLETEDGADSEDGTEPNGPEPDGPDDQGGPEAE